MDEQPTEYFGVSHLYGRFRARDDQGAVRSDDELRVAADEDYAILCERLKVWGFADLLDRQTFDEGYRAGYWHRVYDDRAKALGREPDDIRRNSEKAIYDGSGHACFAWPQIADDATIVEGARMSYAAWSSEMTWDEFVAAYRFGYWLQVAVKHRPNETLYW